MNPYGWTEERGLAADVIRVFSMRAPKGRRCVACGAERTRLYAVGVVGGRGSVKFDPSRPACCYEHFLAL